jgi:quercetin dioxygenase-like cupin family protein
MGDPAEAGPYVERVKLPPNAVIPPHTHPDDENITVLSGAFGIGEGEVADHAKGRVLPAGSFYYLPANMAHFAWAGPEGAIVQIHGIGPSGIKMLHPSSEDQYEKPAVAARASSARSDPGQRLHFR